MEKEVEEAKRKAVLEYKLSEDFLDDIAKGLLSVFHEGFKDYQNKVRKLFLTIDTALLIRLSQVLLTQRQGKQWRCKMLVHLLKPPTNHFKSRNCC